MGRPLPTLELEIHDPDGMPVALGATGEIYVRGDQIAGEYDGRSALTDDGWFPTNDGGRLDPDGFLYVEGRLDDVIVRGGENMSPGEIEDVLLQHPAVADVAVTGVPDDEWGEVVAAVVVLESGTDASEAELQEWVRTHLRLVTCAGAPGDARRTALQRNRQALAASAARGARGASADRTMTATASLFDLTGKVAVVPAGVGVSVARWWVRLPMLVPTS